MSESCDPNSSSNNWDFSSLIISPLIRLIISHPLYLSYFIFFSPYLLKILSFLSPLFLTTTLLSLAFFLPNHFYTSSSSSSFLHIFKHHYYRRNNAAEAEEESLDDLGIYETLFGSSLMVELKTQELENYDDDDDGSSLAEKPLELGSLEKEEVVELVVVNAKSGLKSEMEEKRMENFQKILDGFEKMASEKQQQQPPSRGPKRKPPSHTINYQQPEEQERILKAAESSMEESDGGGGERKLSLKAESLMEVSRNEERKLMAVNSYGSMRREKEWKRTLACKLFEERHNVDGGEGMDSLWEAYENDSNKTTRTKTMTMKATKTTKKKIEKDEEEDEDQVEAPLCCLQALKLSTGKMNLGVGIPNLVKISKAIKGIGWLHKHSKKVHNNNGDR